MLKVLAACGNGNGSSLIIKMRISKIFEKMGIRAEVSHCSVGDAQAMASSCDVIFCSNVMVSNFKSAEERGVVVIGLKNLFSEDEIQGKIQEQLIDAGKIK